MSSYWGDFIKLSVFGESHGPGIGVVIDDLPAGQGLDMEAVRAFMDRRAPGRSPWSSPRQESDRVEVLSGVYKNRTTGTPLAGFIRNRDTRSKDYENLQTIPRPGHADLTGRARYRGANDPRGGGHFSGRLTAAICFAGAVAKQILERQGVRVFAHIKEIAGIEDASLTLESLSQTPEWVQEHQDFPVIDAVQGQKMIDAVEAARMDQDSVGGIVEVVLLGVERGIGNPIFGGLEPKLASFIYGIPAVKALSFGDGFAVTRRRGSENNDALEYVEESSKIRSKTNHGGGIDGGISNGMPIVFQVGIKPTSSISLEQDSVNLETKKNSKLIIHGRHDPCIVPRAVPVLEAAAAIVLLDQLLLSGRFDYEQVGE